MSVKSPHAIVAGSAMIDVIAVIAEENIERVTRRQGEAAILQIEQGRKIPAESIDSHVGGGACNVATSLARRGWRVTPFCRTGADLNAEAIRAHFEREGVDQSLMMTAPEEGTGVSVMIAAYDRNAAIFVHRGANEGVRAEDVAQAAFGQPALFYVAPLSSSSADQFGPLLAAGKAAGAFTAANPGIRQLSSRTDGFFQALDRLDLLSLNAVEAAALVPALIARGASECGSGRAAPLPQNAPELLRRGLHSGGCDLGLRDFFEAVQGFGPRWVLITDGAAGAYLNGPEGMIFCPPAPAEVAGTAGAGDAYCSTLASTLATGGGQAEALVAAAVNAASVVSRVNTTDGLLHASALAERVAVAALEPTIL